MTTAFQAGFAKVGITPEEPVALAGFAIRTGPHRGVTRPLQLRAAVFSANSAAGAASHALLVGADILWWAPERVADLSARIAGRWPIPEDRILLHATHTHGGPQTSVRFAPSLGRPDPDWCALLEERLFEAIERAWDDLAPAAIERGDGSSAIGVNRRWLRGDEPAPPGAAEGTVDRDLTVLRITDPHGDVRALLVHLACHPTTTMDPFVSADFPGVMTAAIESELGPDSIVAFLQGCCGDINPAITKGRDRLGIHDADVETVGHQLASEVRAVLARPMRRLPAGSITARTEVVDLPLQPLPAADVLDRARKRDGITGEWSRLLRDEPDRMTPSVPLTLRRIGFGPDLAFLAMDAEVTMPYGIAIKELSGKRIVPLPYTNGMIGYVVTARQLAQGGYEADESTRYFGLPAPFAPIIERRLIHALERLATPPATSQKTRRMASA